MRIAQQVGIGRYRIHLGDGQDVRSTGRMSGSKDLWAVKVAVLCTHPDNKLQLNFGPATRSDKSPLLFARILLNQNWR
jgi:hypothetical protein